MKNNPFTTATWFGFLYLVILATLVGNIALIYALQNDQKIDSAVVDAAGRNRMLSQKIAFLSLRAAEGDAVSVELSNTIDLHDASFYALKDGGSISGISGLDRVDPAPDSLQPLFIKAEESWVPFRDAARTVAAKSITGVAGSDQESVVAEGLVTQKAAELLDRNNAIVEVFVEENARKQTMLVYALVLLFLVDVLIVLAAYLFSRKLTKALREEVSLKEKSLEKLSGTTKTLDVKTETLEKQRIAMLNVMEDLQGEKARTEAILAGVGEGLFVTDAEQRVMFVNKAFETLLGFSQGEIVGKVLSETIALVKGDGKELRKDERPLAKAIRSEKVVDVSSVESLAYKKKDGSLLAVSITVSPIIVNGQFIGAVEVFRDVTEEREVDKAKSEFVSLASHQLKTPLTSINWYTEILMDKKTGKLSKDQESYVSEIHDASSRMSELVNSLLNVSRLELGTFAIEPAPTDLLRIIDGAVKDQEASFLAKKQKFALKADDTIPTIPLDAKLTHIIIQNLLSNASKYSPDASEIELRVEKTKKSIRISCIDHGYGIPEKQQQSIFKKLFRADNIRKLDVEGTGLGLYIIKSIAEASGCSISFTSEEGRGTTFVFEIPLYGMKGKEGTRNLSQTVEENV